MLFRAALAVSPLLRPRFERALAQPDLVVSSVAGGAGLMRALRDETADLVVVGEELLPSAPREAISAVRALPEAPELVLVVDWENGGERAELLAAGALAVLPDALDDRQMRRAFRTLVARRRETLLLRHRAPPGSGEAASLDPRGSESPAMARLLATAERVARSDSSLLVHGETGTGKEWLARAVHAASRRADKPFVAVNCAALTESLLASELFGHERGSFTGAERAHRGHFEMAHGGTLFLDEIGDMPPSLQAKLLRAVENRLIQRLGSETAVPVDVRVIAATHRDLRAAIAERTFRSDLYFRLAVVELTLPPLRERRRDIPLLARRFVAHYRHRLARSEVRGLSAAALAALESHDWPGNVRELANAVERAVLLADGPEIGVDDLPPGLAGGAGGHGRFDAALFAGDLAAGRAALVAAFEREYLERTLGASRGRMNEAARRAGIDVRTLHGKLKRLGVDRRSYRGAELAPRDT